MPGQVYTIQNILDYVNRTRPSGKNNFDDAQAMINKIYEGRAVNDEDKINGSQLVTLMNVIIDNNELYDPLADLINTRRNEAMVGLINSHNPYTSDEIKDRDMTIFSGNPDPDDKSENKLGQVELEVDGPYSMTMEWNFKGSPQKINKTIRLKYRYRARNLHKPDRPLLEPPHWVTAYLLIGYEDGGE